MNAKTLFLSILLAVVVVGAFLIVNTDNRKLNENTSSDIALQQINDASIEVDKLNAQYASDETTYEINANIVSNSFISIDEFCQHTDCQINMDNNLEFKNFVFNNYLDGYVIKNLNGVRSGNIYALANGLGYNCNLEGDKYVFSRKFATKRLLVECENLNSTYGAVKKIAIGTLNILQYKSEVDAFKAYYNFVDNGIICEIDQFIQCDSVQTEQVQSIGDTGYSTWNGQMMGLDKYVEYLEDLSMQLNEVIVAVVDSGIATNLSIFQGRIIDEYAKSFAPNSIDSYEDEFGHGTSVASIIANWTPNNVKILPIRIFNAEGKSTGVDLALVYKYIYSLLDKGINIKVMNCSYGADYTNSSYAQYVGTSDDVRFVEINKLVKRGLAICASSGNDSLDSRLHTPSCYKGVISVSAIDQDCNFASFSNYGDVDFCAPGVKITSAHFLGETHLKISSGTSVATPHISAVFALLFSNPLENYNFSRAYDICKTRCASDLGDEGWDEEFGYGYIDLRLLLGEYEVGNWKDYNISFNVVDMNASPIYSVGEYNISYYTKNNRIEKINLSDLSTKEALITTNTDLLLDAYMTTSIDLCGWYISSSPELEKGQKVGEKKSTLLSLDNLKKDGTNYIFVVVQVAYVDISFTFIYKDVDTYTGFASFATTTKLYYFDKIDTRWKTSSEYQCGILAESQTFSISVIRGTNVSFKIQGANDSVIKRIINSSNGKMTCTDYAANNISSYVMGDNLNLIIIVEI